MRRTLLLALVPLLLFTAGCADDAAPGPEATPTSAPSTPTPTATATGTATATSTPSETATATPTGTAAGGLDETSGSRPGEEGDALNMDYSWKFMGGSATYTLSLSSSMYDYYGDRPRIRDSERWGAYVTDPYDDAVVRGLAERLERDAAESGFTRTETADYAIAFVQSLRYVPDNVSTPFDEYPKYPVETLVERGGDCEDTSILLAALLREMGYDTVLIFLPGHVGVGIRGDDLPGTYYRMDG